MMLENLHIPRYRELPDIELYMDQLIGYITKYLGFLYPDGKEAIITTSMVNNYVKSGILAPTVKKKYSKDHIANLMMICVFKQIYMISKISQMLQMQAELTDTETVYDCFCEELETALQDAFSGTDGSHLLKSEDELDVHPDDYLLMHASVNAFAQKHLVEKYLEFKLMDAAK